MSTVWGGGCVLSQQLCAGALSGMGAYAMLAESMDLDMNMKNASVLAYLAAMDKQGQQAKKAQALQNRKQALQAEAQKLLAEMKKNERKYARWAKEAHQALVR